MLTGRAQAGHFDNPVLDGEAEPFCILADELFDLRVFNFRGVSASLANEKNAGVIMCRMAAGDIGVAALDPGGDAVFAEEIEYSVDARRREPATLRFFEARAQIIRTEGPFRRPERLEHGFAQGRDLRASQAAGGDRRVEAVASRFIQIRFLMFPARHVSEPVTGK